MADEGAFSVDNRMAAYRVGPTAERPTNDACERRVVANYSPMPIPQMPDFAIRPPDACRA